MKEFWHKFKNGLFTKAQFLTGATISLLLTSGLVWAFTVASMTTFTSGTAISATQVNDNFTYLKERLEALSGGKFVVSTSAPQVFPTIPCCGNNTTGIVDFDVVDIDLAGLGASFNGTDRITVTESSFYEASLVSQLDAGSATSNSVMQVQKYPGGVGSPTVLFQINPYTPGGNLVGARNSFWLNNGDVVEVVAKSNECCSAIDATFVSGTKFSFQKL